MPMYKWLDKKSGKDIEVIRTFDEFENPPQRDEVEKLLTDEEFAAAEWERVIGIPGVVKGYGWGQGKGNW